MKAWPINLGSFAFAFALGFCASCSDITHKNAEENLLKTFETELHDLERFEDKGYIAYMEYQIAQFPKKQKRTVKIIDKINHNFAALKSESQTEYQNKWTRKFQPVINAIYERTRELIVKQTADLTPETMAKIQELTDRMNALERSARAPRLLPVFFTTPSVPDPPKIPRPTPSGT